MDHDALPSLVAQAAAFAFPSTQEGFGLAAMEALAAGVPLVVRDLPVLREVFGSAARRGCDVAQLATALDRAMAAPDPARRAAGRALARAHTWAAAAAAHRRVYDQVCTTASGAGAGAVAVRQPRPPVSKA